MALKDLPVPLPPFEKQQKIVKKIQEAYEQKKKKEAEIKMILAKIDSFVLGELVEFAKETWDQKTTLPCSPYFPLYFFLDLSGKSFRLKPLALSLSLIPSFLLILSILAKRNPY